MKFVPDFCHRLSIGKNLVQISWSKTNLKTLLIYLSNGNLRQNSWSETNLSQTMANAKSMAKIWYKFHGPRQISLRPWPMLSLWQKSSTNFMLRDKFISHFQCSFFHLSRTFRCLSSLSCLYRQQ